MPIEILMPALSPTMTEGNLAKWLKKEGDEVHSGDVLAEIETDKATMEVEAVDDGKIGKILVPEGAQGIKVNEPIALLLGEGEDASALQNFAADLPKPAPPAPPPPAESAQSAPAAAAIPERESGNGRIFASPLARRMAQQAGLELGAIRGSGPQGRIVKSDIEAALSPGRAAPAPTPARSATAPQPAAGRAASSVQGAGGGARRQPALQRAAAQCDAARYCPASDRIQTDRPAFLSDDRLRDRRAVEDSSRAQRKVRGLPDFGQ